MELGGGLELTVIEPARQKAKRQQLANFVNQPEYRAIYCAILEE